MTKPQSPLTRTNDWLRSWTDASFLLMLAYLAAIASFFSYVFITGGSGDPSRLEIGLLSVSVLAAFLLSMDMLGSQRVE